MPLTLNTPRATYVLSLAAPPEDIADATVLSLSLERSDGIEKVALRCRVAKPLASGMDTDSILTRLAQWIERDFETIRENALKSIRSERRLIEFAFDESDRGPF